MISKGVNGSNVEPAQDEKEFWGVLSTVFSAVRLQNMVLTNFAEGSNVFKWVAFKIGAFGILVDTIIDLKNILNDDSLNQSQKYWAVYTVIVTMLLMLLCIMPFIGAAGGPLANFLYLTAVLFIVNALEEFALEQIRGMP